MEELSEEVKKRVAEIMSGKQQPLSPYVKERLAKIKSR